MSNNFLERGIPPRKTVLGDHPTLQVQDGDVIILWILLVY